MSEKFVVVDLETTGNSPQKGERMIQFAAVVIENGEIVEQFSSYVNPGKEIPVFIEELTGIDDKMVKDAPDFSNIAPKVMELLNDAYFVAHNVLFDLSFLQDELLRVGHEGFLGPVLDTVEMARFLYPTADSYKLNDLAGYLGINHERPHQADSDAFVTAELFLIMLERLNRLPTVTLQHLLRLSGGLKSDIALLLDDLVLERSHTLEEPSLSFEVHQGIALKAPMEEDELLLKQEIAYPGEEREKDSLFQRAFPTFEKREGQYKMMDTVYHAFMEQKHALIEAGTGVGKSMAYLLPAAIFSLQKHEPVVVSTYTTQLQEQLLLKDIPILERMLSFPLRIALLKGRGHFINLAKFNQTLREENENFDISLTKMQILVWLLETDTGDGDELNLSSGGALFWKRITDTGSPFFKDSSWNRYDFFLRAKKKAQSAHLIITNHSFLLTDLTSARSTLPEYRYCVLDEGHHVEKAAGKYFGETLDYLSARILISRLGQSEQKNGLYQLVGLIQMKGAEKALLSLNEINQLIHHLIMEMDGFFQLIASYVKKGKHQSSRVSVKLPTRGQKKEWSALFTSGERFYFALGDAAKWVEEGIDLLQKEKGLTSEEKLFLDEMMSIEKEITDLKMAIKNIVLKPSEEAVAWIEADTRSIQNSTSIYTQPLSIAEAFRDKFFAQKKSVVITSASLSVNQSFSYMVKEMGLEGMPYMVEQIDSPFEYGEQLQLMITNDLPEVNAVPMEEYVAAITEHIISIAEATKGRMLILFTSYEMLRKTYHLIKESGILEDYVLLGQGVTAGSRGRLTRNFQQFEKAILFGTSSFWEGIDIPGSDLSCLVMVRLPFSPPNEPVTEAKSRFIQEHGGNPFYEYSLPEAVIRFKQGFGRLIRSREDRGVMIIFDQRLSTTRYGKVFLKSIPQVKLLEKNIYEIVDTIEEWL